MYVIYRERYLGTCKLDRTVMTYHLLDRSQIGLNLDQLEETLLPRYLFSCLIF